ncbi:MAG: hypothetical protein ACHQFZ_04325 [Acidimicrobiales bacterium]
MPGVIESPFNTDFYVVAATVIPIFFLTILLPNGFMFEHWRRVETRYLKQKKDSSLRGLTGAGRHLTYVVQVFFPMFVIAAGGIAETCAILALYSGHASFFERDTVLVFFTALPGVTVFSVMVLVITGSMKDAES